MRHTTTANAIYTVSQTVPNLQAGSTYNVGGWVNIPATTGAFTFTLQVQWRDAAHNVLGKDTVRSYSGTTNGWERAAANLVAPRHDPSPCDHGGHESEWRRVRR